MELAIEKTRRYTVEEYLQIEAQYPEEKFEYRDGFIVNLREALAMAGGSPNHSLITANAIGELRSRLKGSPCQVYSNDLRVQIPRKLLYAYPDASVVCGKAVFETTQSSGDTLTNPRVVIEVLSPSTEGFDRGKKFARYCEIESFEEYILISQDEPRVESYFRGKDGTWTLTPFSGLDAIAKLRSIKIDVPLSEVYAGVEFAEHPAGADTADSP